MFAIVIPAILAAAAVWGVTATIIVSLRDGYRQAPTR
jgi:hypothetical protein